LAPKNAMTMTAFLFGVAFIERLRCRTLEVAVG
jgi:hypothetical protein